MATASEILAIRNELGDTDIALPVMSDDEINYFIDKNNGSIQRATLDTAKSLLFKLSTRTDDTVDIISIRGSRAAANWMAALKLYITSPTLNSLHLSAGGYGGGISKADVEANNANPDNNLVPVTNDSVLVSTPQVNTDNYFSA